MFTGYFDEPTIGLALTYHLQAEVVNSECSLAGTGVSPTPVKLGEWERSRFSAPGITTPPEPFTITLSGTVYRLSVQWRNAEQGGWVLDIADSTGTAIVSGIPLVTGCNLLVAYAHLGFSGALWVQTTADPDAVPTYDNLGDGSHLYWWTDQ
ncbi:MAG: hypothetical protein GAK36_00199 [Pseudomonas sp.]|nr:MAG: hypothetical protein GAK36_00199 [Pseudomonas sp.]